MVIRATTLFNLQRNNVARQVVRKCCPYYLTFTWSERGVIFCFVCWYLLTRTNKVKSLLGTSHLSLASLRIWSSRSRGRLHRLINVHFCVGYHMISYVIRNKPCGLWKIYNCSFIPNCTKKRRKMWLKKLKQEQKTTNLVTSAFLTSLCLTQSLFEKKPAIYFGNSIYRIKFTGQNKLIHIKTHSHLSDCQEIKELRFSFFSRLVSST